MASERVHKLIARAGIASRRAAEDMIKLGEVTINGEIAKVGAHADPDQDAIKVRGKLMLFNEPRVYLAFHKPRGVICMNTVDPENRPTLRTYLDGPLGKLHPIGRLDFNTEGLVLLTNDGTVTAHVLKSASIPRVYQLKMRGIPTRDDLERLARGATIEGALVKPHSVRLVEKLKNKCIVEMTFVGNGSIDVKGLLKRRQLLTERIILRSIGQISLGTIPAGQGKVLKKSQIDALLEQPELALRGVEEGAQPIPGAPRGTDEAEVESPTARGRRKARPFEDREFRKTRSKARIKEAMAAAESEGFTPPPEAPAPVVKTKIRPRSSEESSGEERGYKPRAARSWDKGRRSESRSSVGFAPRGPRVREAGEGEYRPSSRGPRARIGGGRGDGSLRSEGGSRPSIGRPASARPSARITPAGEGRGPRPARRDDKSRGGFKIRFDRGTRPGGGRGGNRD